MPKDIEVGAYYRVILRVKEDVDFYEALLVRGQRLAIENVQMTFVLHKQPVESMAEALKLIGDMAPRINREMTEFLKTPEAEHDGYSDWDEIDVLGVEEVLMQKWEYRLHPAGSYGIELSNILHIVD